MRCRELEKLFRKSHFVCKVDKNAVGIERTTTFYDRSFKLIVKCVHWWKISRNCTSWQNTDAMPHYFTYYYAQCWLDRFNRFSCKFSTVVKRKTTITFINLLNWHVLTTRPDIFSKVCLVIYQNVVKRLWNHSNSTHRPIRVLTWWFPLQNESYVFHKPIKMLQWMKKPICLWRTEKNYLPDNFLKYEEYFKGCMRRDSKKNRSKNVDKQSFSKSNIWWIFRKTNYRAITVSIRFRFVQ